jgi:hypothetical protein
MTKEEAFELEVASFLNPFMEAARRIKSQSIDGWVACDAQCASRNLHSYVNTRHALQIFLKFHLPSEAQGKQGMRTPGWVGSIMVHMQIYDRVFSRLTTIESETQQTQQISLEVTQYGFREKGIFLTLMAERFQVTLQNSPYANPLRIQKRNDFLSSLREDIWRDSRFLYRNPNKDDPDKDFALRIGANEAISQAQKVVQSARLSYRSWRETRWLYLLS